MGRAGRSAVAPLLLLAALVLAWTLLAAWLVPRYPFLSGTDESVDYLAFAAAKNRWPAEDEIARYRLATAYQPPLYYLALAPFWGDEPLLTVGLPAFTNVNTFEVGGYGYRLPAFDPAKHAALEDLYRAAKRFSLALGVVTLLAVAATVRLSVREPGAWWACLLALIPVACLPQFLYYQTLANNDALCTALGSLTVMCFAGACSAAARGDERAHLRWAVGLSAFAGLNLLTKATAAVLLPLLPWTALGALFAPKRGVRGRWLRAGGILCLMAAVAVASGGWWIARNAARGDWSGQELHRALHPWAFTDRPYWQRHGWATFLLATSRSYVGLMAGPHWGVSDSEFIAYAIGPAATALLGFALLARRARARAARPRSAASWWLVSGLAAGVVSNVLGLLWLNREVEAPFGHFLFPSLAAAHGLAALLWWEALGRHPRALAAAAAAAGILYGGAFLHVFRTWMLRAVEQPPEKIVTLAAPPAFLLTEPIVGHEFRQPFLLPPGRAVAFRVRLAATGAAPRLGGSIAGRLVLSDGRGGSQQMPLKTLPLGDVGWTDRFAEFELLNEVAVPEERPAELVFTPRPPLFPRTSPVRFLDCGMQAEPRIGELLRDGAALGGRNLCLAIVYRD